MSYVLIIEYVIAGHKLLGGHRCDLTGKMYWNKRKRRVMGAECT